MTIDSGCQGLESTYPLGHAPLLYVLLGLRKTAKRLRIQYSVPVR